MAVCVLLVGAALARGVASAAGTLPEGPAHTTANLRLRAGAGTTFATLGIMQQGASVVITGAPRSDFYPLEFGALKGWAAGEWLASDARAKDPKTIPPGPAVTTDHLNLRKGPSLEHVVILVIPDGAGVKVLGAPRAGFYPVAYRGKHGWAHGAYLAKEPQDDDDPSPIPTSGVQRIVRRVLAAHGLGRYWTTAAKIVSCESGWNPNAKAMDSNGYYSRGLWQINDQSWLSWWDRFRLRWNDPEDNTLMAVKVYKKAGNSWSPWSCYYATLAARTNG